MAFCGLSIPIQLSWMYALQKCMLLSRHSAKRIVFLYIALSMRKLQTLLYSVNINVLAKEVFELLVYTYNSLFFYANLTIQLTVLVYVFIFVRLATGSLISERGHVKFASVVSMISASWTVLLLTSNVVSFRDMRIFIFELTF